MKKILLSSVLLVLCFVFETKANNMLVQNVTTTGNNTANKTILVQFDKSWENSWRDSINWDAAWVFIKFKDASGNWQHAKLNTTGFTNGTGTANTLQVTSDQIGAWVYLSALGIGNFSSTGMQLQWNYGLSGLTDITGLEVRVFAVEMVYVPEGEFNCAGANLNTSNNASFFINDTTNNNRYGKFYAPGNNHPAINQRLSPSLIYYDGTSSTIRIKGDAGIDIDNNGTIDNTTYPIGYKAFYCYKYELTEQQYADFLNTLTSSQKTTLGVAGTGITLTNGQYFSSTPNKACNNGTATRLLAYADWSGIRPMTFLEFNKASYGPLQPVYSNNYPIDGYPSWGKPFKPNNFSSTASNTGYLATSNSNRETAGASYYGILELTGSTFEPLVKLNFFNFTTNNGNGILTTTGNTDVGNWSSNGMIFFVDQQSQTQNFYINNRGFRYVRSAE